MRARLILESGVASPCVRDLDENTALMLGRNADSSVVLKDGLASREHARVYARGGCFWIAHLSQTNPTKVNGVIVERDVPLEDGQQIRIGETSFRFVHVADGGSPDVCGAELPAMESTAQTVFQPGEFHALLGFMNDSMGGATPQQLVGYALDAVRRHTRADLAGFFSLDDRPELHQILPEQGAIDDQLSRQLTQRVLREKRTVWLGGEGEPRLDSVRLSGVSDAVCVALRIAGEEQPLGALHIYKKGRRFDHRQVQFCEVLAGCMASALCLSRERRALEADNRRLRGRAAAAGTLVGHSAAMETLRDTIAQLAPCPCTVLIRGETGVGKELVALGLHHNSTRSNGPLVRVNCAAINEELAESELFGHVKGAFTHALRDHDGLFAQAEMGTLFLDEVGDLSMALQTKLLRALEDRSFRPVGARKEVKVNVRIIAATNRDLESEVREGNFREDLYYRLAVAPLTVPPLRDHAEDVPELASHFLHLFADEYHRRVSLSEGALARLVAYSWPGNVRELHSALERAVAMSKPRGVIHAGDLHLVGDLCEVPEDYPPSLDMEEVEQWAIRRALERTDGVMVRAAEMLGIGRDTLGAKMRKYGIDR